MDEILKQIEHSANQLEGESLDSVMATFTCHGTSEDYDDYLNEIYGEIEICGYRYLAAKAFEEVDPIAYRCGYSDYFDYLLSESDYVEYKDQAYLREDLLHWLEKHTGLFSNEE